MKVKVDFYRDTGKWYSNCELEIPNDIIYSNKQVEGYILDKQTAMRSHEGYYMVVTDLHDSDPFFMRLYRLYDYTKMR